MTTKHDQEKPMYNLLPPKAIDEVAKVLTFGAKKYAPNNWKTVPDANERYTAAALRHIFAMMQGEKIDAESMLPHAAHAMCCLAFILELDGVESNSANMSASDVESASNAGIGIGDLVYSEDEAIIGRVESISSHSAVIECDDCFVTRDANELVLIKKAGEE